MKNISSIILYTSCLALFSFFACHKKDDPTPISASNNTTGTTPATGTLALEIDHAFGSDEFQFNTPFRTQFGDTVRFTKLKYYISNIKITQDDGTVIVVPKDSCYRLIDFGNATSTRVSFSGVPVGSYKALEFIIGVDSLKSTSPIGERKGVLDVTIPDKGQDMYWIWNSGYIFFKLEGTSSQISSGGSLQYHIGGYGGYSAATVNNIKKVQLTLPSSFPVTTATHPEVHLKADIAQVFKSPKTISVSEYSTIMGGPKTQDISANYADMFVVDHVHDNE